MQRASKLLVASLLSLLTVAGCSSQNDGAPDAAAAQPDAGACVACKPDFLCLFTPGGDTLDLKGAKKGDGVCSLGGAFLACGGTGTDATGKPLTWEAGDKLGPTGGPGIVVRFENQRLNCE